MGKDDATMETAVIYTRVSSDEQVKKGTGLENQLEDCQVLADDKGYQVVEMFSDPGISGREFENRPGLQAMLNYLYTNQVDWVVAWNMERLGRRAGVWGQVVDKLEDLEVKLDLKHGGDNPDIHQYVGAGTSVVSRELRDKLVAGLHRSVREYGSVQVGARPPYGYDKHTEIIVEGTKERKLNSLVVNSKEARQVRRMFKKYLELGTLRAVGRDLRRRGVATKMQTLTGKKGKRDWAVSVVRGMLTNMVYIGRFAFRKRKWVKTPGTKHGKLVARPESDWLWVDVPRIIDDATFDLVQQKLTDNANPMLRARRPHGPDYLLRGRVRCGRCGYAVVGKRFKGAGKKMYPYYQCTQRSKSLCKLPEFNATKVDGALTTYLVQLLADKKYLETYIANRKAEAKGDKLKAELDDLKAAAAKVKAEQELLVDLYTQKRIDMATFDGRKETAEQQLRNIRIKRSELLQEVRTVQLSDEHLRMLWAGTYKRVKKVKDPDAILAAWHAIEAEPDPMRREEMIYNYEEALEQLHPTMQRWIAQFDVRAVLSTHRNKRLLTIVTKLGDEAVVPLNKMGAISGRNTQVFSATVPV
jgi:DNA invertase Pin-like site-specific DNA recombinase